MGGTAAQEELCDFENLRMEAVITRAVECSLVLTLCCDAHCSFDVSPARHIVCSCFFACYCVRRRDLCCRCCSHCIGERFEADNNPGGGLWHPEAAPTAAMRRNIDHHPEMIKSVLMEDKMRKEFLKGAPKQESKVVKAFVASNAGNALKTRPKVSSASSS